MAWYYASNGQRRGPVSEAEFQDLIRRGAIAPEALVWTAGMAEWRRLSEVAPDLPPPLPASAGEGPAAAADGATAALPPASSASSVLRVTEVAVPPRYAGFWIRVLARLIDGVILWVVGQVLMALLVASVLPDALGALSLEPGEEPTPEQLMTLAAVFGVMMASSVVTGLAYDLVFLKVWSATPGKLMLGLRVRMADGGPLSAGRIIGRYFAVSLSGLIMGIGYLMVGFDAERRGLHDHLCSTRVVRPR